MPKRLSTLEIRTKIVDLGLVGFSRGAVVREGNHVRSVLLPKDTKGLSREIVAGFLHVSGLDVGAFWMRKRDRARPYM